MDSLRNLMSKKDFDTPKEVVIIKDFLRKHFQRDATVNLSSYAITIVVESASLAGALRAKLEALKKELETSKKIYIKIGKD